MDNLSLYFMWPKVSIGGKPDFKKDKDVQADITLIVIPGRTNIYCQFLKDIQRSASETKAG